MKQFKTLFALIIILSSISLDSSAGPDPWISWDCIEYNSLYGWHLNANYQLSNPKCSDNTPVITELWIKDNNTIYGPYSSHQSFGSTVIFQIPSQFHNDLANGECLQISMLTRCHDHFVREPIDYFDTCPCPNTQNAKDNCIAQYEYKINTQTYPNSNNNYFAIDLNDNEYPAIGAYLPTLTTGYKCFGSSWAPPIPPGASTTYLPKYEIEDTWTFDDLLNPLITKTFTNYNNPNIYNNSLISHNSFTQIIPFNSFNTPIKVCHRKKITLTCGPYFGQIPIGGLNNSLLGKVVYDCKICHDICTEDILPSNEIDVIYTEPTTTTDEGKPGKEENHNSNFTNIEINDIKIVPNPAANKISVGFTSNIDQRLSLTILDITGKVMQNETLNIAKDYNMNKVNVSNLTNGNYILVITDEEGNTYKEKITILK